MMELALSAMFAGGLVGVADPYLGLLMVAMAIKPARPQEAGWITFGQPFLGSKTTP